MKTEKNHNLKNDPYCFGTAGWSYKDWLGTVYPENVPLGFNHLSFLAEKFDFVEVNTTFYHIPSLKLTQGWIKKTESLKNFSFWIKIFQNFTHKKILISEEINNFKRAIEPLKSESKLSGLLAQFPYSFKLNSTNFEHLKSMMESFIDYPLAIEFRHRSWDNDDIIDYFIDNNLIWVNIDQPVISYSLPLTDYHTNSETNYFRLHGRNYQSWFSQQGRDARYNYYYNAIELNQISEKIKKLKEKTKKIFISGNNHYRGNAVKNLLELKNILKTD